MTNFTNTNKTKGVLMNREQKANRTSIPNTGLAAKLSTPPRVEGSGAPSRTRALLAGLALAICAIALTAAPALAAPTLTTPVVSEVSYATAHVSSQLDPNPKGEFVSYSFQVSTNGTDWTNKAGALNFGSKETLNATLSGLEDGTPYFVRVIAKNGFEAEPPETISPAVPPYPEFTTLTADPPSVETTDNASEVKYTTAQATGKVNRPAKSDDLTCNFEYITDDAYLANPVNDRFSGATPVPCETDPPTDPPTTPGVISAPGSNSVHAKLTELANDTTFHLRLAVAGAGGKDAKEAPSTFKTLKVDPPSVVSIENASEVKYNQAQVKGLVKRPTTSEDPAFDLNCNFEYIADADYQANSPAERFAGATPVGCLQNPVTAASADPTTGEQSVSAELPGLRSGTTFHLRLSATNLGGSDSKEAASVFITQTLTPPTSAIDPPGVVGYTTAHISGTVDPEGGNIDPTTSEPFPINWQLQYALGSEPGNWQFGEAGTIAGAEATSTDPIAVAKDLEGLQFDTEYKFRLIATYADREAISTEGSFTTEPVAKPIVTLDPVTTLTDTTAKFTGTVDSGAPAVSLSTEGEALYQTAWHIECQPDCPGLSGGTVKAGEGAKPFSIDATGLEPNVSYEVKLIATNAAGTTTQVQNFSTSRILPSVRTNPGGSDGEGGYILEGVVNPHNSSITNCEFKWGPDSNYVFKADCSPMPKGRDEVQGIGVHADGGQIKLTYRAQSTADLPFDSSAAEVQSALEGLVGIGPGSVAVTRSFSPPLILGGIEFVAGSYGWTVTFQGSLSETNVAQIGIENGTVPLSTVNAGGDAAGRSTDTKVAGGNDRPVTVEAHLTGLNPGSVYHFKLFATNAAGEEESNPDREFTPSLAVKEPCPANEQLRTENSSLALPECRAYEMVTPPGKEGFDATFNEFSGGERVLYLSGAGNIARSGQGALLANRYVATRSATGWETISNLNGSSGSVYDAPTFALGALESPRYSADLLSSLWSFHREGETPNRFQLRRPDGTFVTIGPGKHSNANSFIYPANTLSSDDLSHLVVGTAAGSYGGTEWGPGAYEYVGVEVEQPRRVDVDNFDAPISTCIIEIDQVAFARSISADGRTVVFTVGGGCGGANPPAQELWARVGGATSFDVSASQCKRLDCNAPANATFQKAASDGSRIFFTTTQQLLDADTDQTTDLYACDIPAGTPAPIGKANPCPALRLISTGSPTGAGFESLAAISQNGASALFTAKAMLTDDEDAFGNTALAGDHNLYLWRTDAAHSSGQTSFVGRLDSDDVGSAQATPDGRYLLFTTATPLVPTDSDTARDVYRYEADTGELTRASTNVFGVAGNGDFAAGIGSATEHHPTTSITDDGQKIVFVTTEGLSPTDGNAESDVYLWTPTGVSLITTGSVNGGFISISNIGNLQVPVSIDGSGQNIYFQTPGALTPADGDDSVDVYDARIDGGFSFAPPPICTGEKCQPDPTPASPNPPSPANTPNGDGNVKPPKPCPKGKVRKKNGKCAKKQKKHHKKSHKKAGHNRGGSK